MPKLSDNLTQEQVKKSKKTRAIGYVPGLRVQIVNGRGYYVLRRRFQGRRVHLGCGAVETTPLQVARLLAADFDKQLTLGVDVCAEKHKKRKEAAAKRAADAARALIPTFREACEAFISSKESGWKNPATARDARAALKRWVYPHAGDVKVSNVSLSHLLAVFKAPSGEGIFWNAHRDTAMRLRGYLQNILASAVSKGDRPENSLNPASWENALKFHLPAERIKDKGNRPAMPYLEIPDFFVRLQACNTHSARALMFIILTGVRVGEALGARWAEIDREKRTWTIPGGRTGRMKEGLPHTVPLSPAALTVLDSLLVMEDAPDLVFPSSRGTGKPLVKDSIMTLYRQTLKFEGFTTHGFRASFRSWGADEGFSDETMEKCLAHGDPNQVQSCYKRDGLRVKLLDAKREVFDAWGKFVTSATGV
jgi:integrase